MLNTQTPAARLIQLIDRCKVKEKEIQTIKEEIRTLKNVYLNDGYVHL
jgi:ABC-type transporter Mla MlaB component